MNDRTATEKGPSGSRRTLMEHGGIFALALGYFSVVARLRIADDDEGFYALAGRLMLEGLLPYRDFFLPQMPLGPFLYGLWQAALGPGLVVARSLSALLSAATALLVYHAAWRTAGRAAGAVAFALFAAHLLVWEWAVTVKTFPVAIALSTGALVVATGRRASGGRAAAAGVLGGLAVASRLMVLPVLPSVLLAYALRAEPARERARLCAVAACGFGAALLPVVGLALADGEAFWFDNLTYHSIRSAGEGLVKDGEQKLAAARALFLAPLGSSRPDSTGLQTTPLVVAMAAALLGKRWGMPRPYLAFAAMGLGMIGVSFLPSPVWTQYFALAVAPGAILAAPWLCRPGCGVRRRVAAAGMVAAYAAVAAPAFMERIVQPPAVKRVAAADAVGRALDGVTREGDVVAAHWPGYLVASRRAALPAARNQFARLYSTRVAPERRRRFHLYTEEDFAAALLAGEAQAFVAGRFVVPATGVSLRDAGWRRAADLTGASIWVPPERVR